MPLLMPVRKTLKWLGKAPALKRPSFLRKRHPPVGARPGTLVIHQEALAPKIRVMVYDAETLAEYEGVDQQQLVALHRELDQSAGKNIWVDVQGLGSEEILRQVGELVAIHPLALEDVVNAPVRPKSEIYDDHLLVITRMVLPNSTAPETEQVGLVVTPRALVTFQERYGDVLEPVRARLRGTASLMRRSGPDYLAYAVIDAIIDAYFPLVDAIGEELEELEEKVIGSPSSELLHRLNRLKRSLLVIRRAVAPQREAVSALIRDESRFVTKQVRTYLRDVHDHCVQTTEAVDSAREVVNGLLNTHLSMLSHRTNEVMKVLTIVASIFVPLTFLAGIYGMNFEYMPELHTRWAYPVLLGIMVALALGMVVYFWRKGWIGGSDDLDED